MKLLPPTFPERTNIHLVNPTRFSVHVSPLVNLVASAPQHTDDGNETLRSLKLSELVATLGGRDVAE